VLPSAWRSSGCSAPRELFPSERRQVAQRRTLRTLSPETRESASKSRSRCKTSRSLRSAAAAIRQSTEERTVSPARRAVRSERTCRPGSSGRSPSRPIIPHRREVSGPGARPREPEDLPSTRALQELFEGPVHGGRIGFFPRDPRGLFQQLLVEHKICAFHAHGVAPARRTSNRCGGHRRRAPGLSSSISGTNRDFAVTADPKAPAGVSASSDRAPRGTRLAPWLDRPT
jgi:hypothetical protein